MRKSRPILGKLLKTLHSGSNLKLYIKTPHGANRTYHLRIKSLAQYLKRNGIDNGSMLCHILV
ncbi:hypothetical protein [Tenacibaculum ovolyticum]|uniref:hypothetical protein n=1 Tax=Tenacibaculum ovolyticum TaxID=104270 RepID=UPI003BAA904D